MTVDAALSGCRFLHFASAMLLWGAFAFLRTLVPSDLAAGIGRRLRWLWIVAAAIAVATIAAGLPLEAAMIGDGWADAFDPVTLRAVLFETTVGHAWLGQAFAALLLLAAFAAPERMRMAAVALAAGLATASAALTGHAVMQAGWTGIAHRLNDACHILAGGAWLGALVPLLMVHRAFDRPESRRQAGTALRKFSFAGHFAVAVVLLSGVANTMLVLGRWPTQWSSPYQAMLAAKIAVVAVMTGLAIVNRYHFVPRLAGLPDDSMRAIRLVTIAEIVLGVVVVGLVSVFGMLEPA
ncbi:copper homeostasis membrane protein CopD [Mesorhizobium sp. PAMC28654]|uniref:copper homeostasis membrane protein CopD n=1 Tax=Mesorhizobium sp. PAMC28654 TaxID=2880934 RepID=UPI001D0B3FF1|nr:copper homeostasis membrane protein CopD [Mesorhizobium sp. PAMC28654]UDL89209.1 copper homeostasis membrane protein CopD [Mesorhizobium sp. PAMC28654]